MDVSWSNVTDHPPISILGIKTICDKGIKVSKYNPGIREFIIQHMLESFHQPSKELAL